MSTIPRRASLNFGKTAVIGGVDHIAAICGKCGGSGYLPGYEAIDGARCWGCGGHCGVLAWIPKAEAEKVLRRRERDAERRAAKRLAEQEALAAEAAAKREEQATELAEWKKANADVADALAAYRGRNPFLCDMASQLAETPLTERQAKAARAALERAAQQAAAATDVPAGRNQVEGVIMAFKTVEHDYGYGGVTVKMTVDCGTYRLYGTLPRAISEASKGDRVAFTATLEPGREKGFGFFSRPTKASILENPTEGASDDEAPDQLSKEFANA
jgi:hypothetical protein